MGTASRRAVSRADLAAGRRRTCSPCPRQAQLRPGGARRRVRPDFGTPDDQITTHVDVSGFVTRKKAALSAHASQTRVFFLLRLPGDVVDVAGGTESFAPAVADGPHGESDQFAGLR
jgi:LmbE family N-acetylglucosaminyl deacetylase